MGPTRIRIDGTTKVAISGAQVLDVSVDGTSGNLAIALSAPINGLDGTNDTIAISSGFVTKVGAAQVQVIENATVTSAVTPPPLDIVIIGAEYDSAGNGSLELKVGASGSKFAATLTKTDFDWGHLTVSKDGGAFASFALN